MPRISRKSIKSNFVHIVTQGIKKEFIFYKEIYRNEYISLLKKYIKELEKIEILAYCVMSNHAHILIYTKDIDTMSTFMRKVNTAFAIYYNKMENRVGYVFANRYYSQVIEDEKHLLTCIGYIHQNPVKAGLSKSANEYKYSSYNTFFQNRLNKNIAKLIFGTEKYLPKFYNLSRLQSKNIIIDIVNENEKEDSNKNNIEKIIESFCEKYEVNLNQIRKSNYLILKFKEYLNRNSKVSNKTICNILKIGKNRINSILQL